MERGGDCLGGLPEERLDSEHRHDGGIQKGLQVLGQEAMSEIPERELDIRSGITSPQSPHREAEARGEADHCLRGRDGPGATTATASDPSPKAASRNRSATNAARRVTRSKNAEQRNQNAGTASRQGTEPTIGSAPR
jgi:hypothetical protein